MGHRAQYVVVGDDRTTDVFYSHWGAKSVAGFLVGGPEHALRSIRAQAPSDEWLDDVWGEGAILVDPAARRLLLFGDADQTVELAGLRALVAVVRHAWSGWRVDWAWDGLGDLAVHLGLSRDLVRTSLPEQVDFGDSVFDDADYPPSAVLSVADPAGIRVTGSGLTDPEDLLAAGPGLASAIRGAPLRSVADLTFGVHVDQRRSELLVWSTQAEPGVTELVADRWPGWTLRFVGDRIEDHVGAAGGAFAMPRPDYRAAVDAVSDIASRHWETDLAARARDLLDVSVRTRHGEDPGRVEVNPHFFDHVLVPAGVEPAEAAARAVAATHRELDEHGTLPPAFGQDGS